MTTKIAVLLAIAASGALLSGCGAKEESTGPATKTEATPKSGPVTKPSGARMDVGSEQQAATEANGG